MGNPSRGEPPGASGRPEIRLLGEPAVLRSGAPAPLPASRKARALLTYLVRTARPHPRTALCELLFEGPADPRAALRWCLAKLRPALDDDRKRLIGDREHVGFVQEGAAVDVERLHSVVARAGELESDDLAAAADALEGELAAGLELSGCPRFEAWLAAEREDARRAQIALRREVVARLADDASAALPHARRRLVLDPLDESAQAGVVVLLGRLGRVAEARAEADRFRRRVQEELGVPPTGALAEALRGLASPAELRERIEVRAPTPSGDSAEASETATAPLVGREEEQRRFARALDRAARGTPTPLVLVVGEPGIGKSRLLGCAADLVREQGGAVLHGRSHEAELAQPFGPWIEALRTAPRAAIEPDATELAPLLWNPAPDGAPAERSRLLAAAVRALGRVGTPTAPALVVLDDVQWIDDASAALLALAVRELAEAPILFVAAARPGELVDDPAAVRLVRQLRRERRLERIELGPLEARDTAALVRACGGDGDPEEVHVRSGGHPLFALELARATGFRDGSLPPRLEELLLERIERLSAEARELVDTAAVHGRAVRTDAWVRATGLDPGPAARALRELERRNVIGPVAGCADGEVDFTHDLLRRAAQSRVAPTLRPLLHRAWVGVLEPAAREHGASAADLARHAAGTGDRSLAARAALQAAEYALRLGARAEALDWARRGLELVAGLEPAERLPLSMRLLRAEVHAGLGRERPRELSVRVSRDVLEAQAHGMHAEVQTGLYLLSVLDEESGDFERAERHSKRAAEAASRGDAATAVRALANTGRCLAQLERDVDQAEEFLRRAGERAQEAGFEPLDLPWGLGLVCRFAGEERSARKQLVRAHARACIESNDWAAFECAAHLVMLDLEAGRHEEALARAPEVRAHAVRLGSGSEEALCDAFEALARRRARTGDSPSDLEAALEGLRRFDTKAMLAWFLNLVAEEDLADGRAAAARERATEALSAAEAVGRRGQAALSRALLARVALAEGDPERAIECISPVLPHLVQPRGVSARARRAATEVARHAGLTLPGGPPTTP